MQYEFRPMSSCEMCGSTRFKLLGLRLNTQQGKRPRRAAGVAVSIKQCRDCTLIFPDPQPVPDSIESHYGRPPESYWKPKYFEVAENYFGAQIATAKQLLDFKDGMRALDVGAGLGKAMIALQRAGFDAYGLEPSPHFRDRAIETGIDPARIQLAGAETAQYPDGHFDFVTFGAVLEHLYSPAESLGRALRWLRPGGIIHAEVPCTRYFVHKIINLYYRLWGTTYVTNTSPMHPPYHLWEFGRESFERHGARTGYDIAKVERLVGGIVSLPKITHGPFKAYMRRTGTGMQLVVWLAKRPA